ncbi:MAG: T9SS type A sorting domain-containing protein [Bacteroidota bacterium]
MKKSYFFFLNYLLLSLFMAPSPSAFAQWSALETPESLPSFSEMEKAGDVLIATAFTSGVFRSDDNGESWYAIQNGLPPEVNWNSLAIIGDNIFIASSSSGAIPYKSSDLGQTWVPMDLGFPDPITINALEHFGNDLFAGGTFGISVSLDMGETWVPLAGGGLPSSIRNLSISDDGIFVASTFGVFRSINDGITFEDISASVEGGAYGVSQVGGRVFAYFTTPDVIYYTDDYINWTASNFPFNLTLIYQIRQIGNNIFACGSGNFYQSDDNGETWGTANAGIPTTNFSRSIIEASNGNLIGSTFRGMYISSDSGETWAPSNTGLPEVNVAFSDIIVHQDKLFTASGLSLYQSSDNGDTWTEQIGGFPIDPRLFSLLEHDGQLYGFGNEEMVRTGNGGMNWDDISDQLPEDEIVFRTGADESSLYVGSFSRLYRSIDGGQNWVHINPNDFFSIGFMYAEGDYIFSGSRGDNFHRADKMTLDWTFIGGSFPPDLRFRTMASNSHGIYLVSESGVYFSSDDGSNWQQIDSGLPDTLAREAILATEEFVCISAGDRVYFSLSDTVDWVDINENLPSGFFPEKMILKGSDLYVGDEGGIWKRSIFDFFTSANEEGRLIELNISPNPVQDIALLSTAGLSIEKGQLSIFNSSGKLVRFEQLEIFNDFHPIDVSVLAPGNYFIDIQDENGHRYIGQFLRQ